LREEGSPSHPLKRTLAMRLPSFILRLRFIIYNGCHGFGRQFRNAPLAHALCMRARRTHLGRGHLAAVTKGQSPEVVKAATDLGLSFFGENKIQEAKVKIPLCPGRLRWHFIGHLQSNKCRDAMELFEMIQSVDCLSLAREIAKRRNKQPRQCQ